MVNHYIIQHVYIVLRGENMNVVKQMNENKCNTCYYAKGKFSCKIMKERFNECWAWADEEEAKKRERAIKRYSSK